MHDFMSYCLRQYFKTTGWNDDNQYSNLCSASRAILDFKTPRGFTFEISKIQSPMFNSSYSMNASPTLNGSISYLFTSRPLVIEPSFRLNFVEMVDRFHLDPFARANRVDNTKGDIKNEEIKPINAIYTKRFSPWMQCVITGVSEPRMKEASHCTGELQYDAGKWCTEASYSTDGELFGLKGLYNLSNYSPEGNTEHVDTFTNKKEGMTNGIKKSVVEKNTFDESSNSDEDDMVEALKGEWSIGAELYYGIRDKNGGVSAGIRYRTVPQFSAQSPLTVTYIFNPFMGHMSAAFAAQVSEDLALCPRYEFNIYSYESDLTIGAEWWQREDIDDANIASHESPKLKGDIQGVVKATISTEKDDTEGLYLA
ncbi:14029_t:CDS:2 [Cetraspora pellucida]|uniref:Mitochondrial distribution and morphology protein 10 n=1 Tax=Cetraspora pellucida TaxID=1433469 RepID=A0A9N9H6G7_9GLOM|nr:14029_t:CDS:2 [Cetraspora pellucida]